ncbi:MAG: ABC transporter permease [Cytophaga sp.]|uniref:ABC transporter permease n=1 Tax=Cytophaga sp. TaxID=29535 RepID=UPI003F80BC1A
MGIIKEDHLIIIKALIIKDLKLKYKNSILGYFWSLLHPVIYIAIFYVVFSKAFPTVENYALYILSGILFWTFFSTGTSQMTNSIVSGAQILKSIYIPGYFFTLSLLASALINFILSLIPFAFLMFFLGAKFDFNLICIIPVTILFTLFTYGFGLMLASLNVFYRDVNMIWMSFSPAIFYATPVAYVIDIVPAEWRVYYKLNPLMHFLEAIHHVIYNGLWLTWTELGILSLLAALSMYIGTSIYSKLEKGFVSNL